LLRSERNIGRELRDALAALFDPEPNSHPAGGRYLEFKQRSAGRSRDSIRNGQIYRYIQEMIENGASLTAAQLSAGEQFCLGAEMIAKIWSNQRRLNKLPAEIANVTFYTLVEVIKSRN
jgi:hypothetical protein